MCYCVWEIILQLVAKGLKQINRTVQLDKFSGKLTASGRRGSNAACTAAFTSMLKIIVAVTLVGVCSREAEQLRLCSIDIFRGFRVQPPYMFPYTVTA